jgi:ADP-ribosylglycohydrolase
VTENGVNSRELDAISRRGYNAEKKFSHRRQEAGTGMAALTMAVDTYRDKVFGAWQGKSAGVTLGAPQRGHLAPGRNNFYSPVPGQPAASVALDFPLVWLHTLEETGPDVVPEDLAVAWLEHLDYSHDEFGYAALNLRRGLPPPAAGAYANWFRHATGGVMRADFWAMIAPGSPQTAATYAYHDAKLDHSEEGVWAAMFLAAVGSAAFFLSDPIILLTIGLAMMPKTCRTARSVKTAIAAWQRAASWLEARESVQHTVGHKNYTDAPQNVGFFTIGLLYGQRDFGTSLCAAVNCGYDAEVTGGMMGAIMGILKGSSGLPESWVAPVGDLVIPGLGMRDYDTPMSLLDVVDRTVSVGRRVVADRCPDVSLAEGAVSAPLSSPTPFAAAATVPGVNSRFVDLDLAPNASEASALDPDAEDRETRRQGDRATGAVLIPDSPLAGETPPPVNMPVAPGEVLPYMQPAQVNEQPIATDPDLIEAGSIHGAEAEETGLTLQTDDEMPLSATASLSNLSNAPDGVAAQTSAYDTTNTPTAPVPPSLFKPQAVSQTPPAPPAGLTADPFADPIASGFSPAPAPDPVDAIAWADSVRIRPLLITPPNALVGQAGPLDVIMDTGDSPTIAYNAPKTLSFLVTNHTNEAFSGRVTLLAPPGWQIAAPANIGQRQFIAARTGTLRADFSVRAPDSAARIDIANAVTLRFAPDNGNPPFEAEFVLLGAACWWTVGPFANFDGEGFDRSYAPEDRPGVNESYVSRSMQNARWEKRTYTESTLDLEALFKGSSGVCYGQTILRSPTGRDARLVANTNSGVKVWMNGALVLRRFNREPFRPLLGSGPWAADVTLRAGDNPLLLKWVRSTEPYEFSLTVSDRFGRGLPEIGNTTW